MIDVIERARSTLRHALSWMATPGEVQLRLLGESAFDPETDIMDQAESAVLAARRLFESRVTPESTVRFLEDLLQDIVGAIYTDEKHVGRDAVLTDPFWQDVRSRATYQLNQLGLSYFEPDPDLTMGPDGKFERPTRPVEDEN